MPYKHAQHLQRFADCPPEGAQPRSTRAFRWAYSPLAQVSFDAPAAKKPKRGFGPSACCGDYGVSFFASESQARTRYARLAASMGTAPAQVALGTHLAEGDLLPGDGAQTLPDKGGHFDLYEDVAVSLVSRFQIVGPL